MTDPHRRVTLDDFNNIPDMSLTDEKIADMLAAEQANHQGGWDRINLTDDQYAVPPDPPAILELIYAGRRHVLSGAPETAKTLVAYITTLTAIRDGWTCAIIDFEMGPTATRRMLTDLGATLDEIRGIYYVAPATPPADELKSIIDHRAQLVLIDAAIGAYDAQDLDDNRRQDAEKFARTWITPLWHNKITTLLVDHVTKNVDQRGKFTIGSERKLGSADVHLGLEALQTIKRGGKGLIKVHVHKDRPGFLNRPTCAMIELASDPDTHQISWKIDQTQHSDEPWKPTILMQRASEYLATCSEPVSFNTVITNVKGRDEMIKEALEHLITDDHVTVESGARGARNVLLKTPYSAPLPTSSHLFPEEVTTTSSTSSPPTGGEEEVGRGSEDVTSSATIDVYDPDVQRLLDGADRDSDIPF